MGKIKVLFEDLIVINQEIWFFSKYFNGLLKMDMDNGVVDVVSSIPKYKYDSERLVVKLIEFNGKIYCIPLKADEIWIYHIDSNIWESIELDDSITVKDGLKFFQAKLFNDKICCVPAFYQRIVMIDTMTNRLTYIAFMDEYTKKSHYYLKDGFFRTDCAVKDDTLFLASCIDNRILCFNIVNYRVEWLTLGEKDNTYSGIMCIGNEFFISPRRSGNVIIWNGVNNYKEIVLPELENNYFLGIVGFNEKIYISGQSECGNIIIDEKTKSVNIEYLPLLARKVLEKEGLMVSIRQSGDIDIETLSDIKKTLKCEIDKEKIIPFINTEEILRESEIMTLDMFLNLI
ncbi:MAG: hypothetical protein ACK5LY_00755 [Lachnospirales bacterium]